MMEITMKDLLEAGVHFGHRTRRWNPKMRPYIFTERNGIHIIDLAQTLEALQRAYEGVRDTVAEGGYVLFVGTKRQAQEIIANEAQRCGMPYVNQRWLGGTLTNFRTIRSRVEYLLDLEARRARGEFELLPKKERLKLERLIDKLNRRLGGLKTMETLPDMLYIVDVNREAIAVKEALILGLPVVAMVDTNSDPEGIEYVIPANDDAIRAIKLITGFIADAVVEGRNLYESMRAERMAEEAEEIEIPEQRVFAPTDEVTYYEEPVVAAAEEYEEYEEFEETAVSARQRAPKAEDEEEEEFEELEEQ